MLIANLNTDSKWLLAVLISALLLLPLRMGFAMNMDNGSMATQNSKSEQVCMHNMQQGDQAIQMDHCNGCNMEDGCAGQCVDCSHCQMLTLPLSLDTASVNTLHHLPGYLFRSHEYLSSLDLRPPRHLI